MKKVWMILSCTALAATVLALLLFYGGQISLDANKLMLNLSTAVWFASALLWMRRGQEEN
jgi:hypothetical protein